MANVLLGVTGSVAAVRVESLYEHLRGAGHCVKIVATRAATFFFDPTAIDPLTHDGSAKRNPQTVILDEDEWRGMDQGERFTLGDPVPHIELRRWAEVFVLAPLDANTLAKLAWGLADNCLTCVFRAWDLSRPVVLAPAMNTLMWEHPLTAGHLRQLAELFCDKKSSPPPDLSLESLMEWINQRDMRLRIVPPQSKRLACGDIGVGGLAEVQDVVRMTNELVLM